MMSPPTTTRPSGWRPAPPCPQPSAIGKLPIRAAKVVIMIAFFFTMPNEHDHADKDVSVSGMPNRYSVSNATGAGKDGQRMNKTLIENSEQVDAQPNGRRTSVSFRRQARVTASVLAGPAAPC